MLVRIEGVDYSVPSQWQQLQVEAWVGVADIRLVCRGQTQVVPKQLAERRQVHYRDLVAWIIPKDALSSCFSTQGIT